MLENVNLEIQHNKNNRILGIIKFISDNLINTFYYGLFLKESEKEIIINHILSILNTNEPEDLELWRLNFRRILWGDYQTIEEVGHNLTTKEKVKLKEKINSICSPKLIELLSATPKEFDDFASKFDNMSFLDIKKMSIAENNIKAINSKIKSIGTKRKNTWRYSIIL